MSNPVDMIAAATAYEYGQAVRILARAPEIDSVIVMFNTPLITRASTSLPSSLPPRPSSATTRFLLRSS